MPTNSETRETDVVLEDEDPDFEMPGEIPIFTSTPASASAEAVAGDTPVDGVVVAAVDTAQAEESTCAQVVIPAPAAPVVGAVGDPSSNDASGASAASDLVTVRLDALLAAVESFSEKSAADAALIARLHADNQTLRRGEAAKLLGPVRIGLVQLYGECRTVASTILASDATASSLAGTVSTLGIRIERLLEQLDLVPLTTMVGDTFDPRQQQGVSRVSTSVREQDGTIASVEWEGFTEPNAPKPAAPAKVSVYRYDAPPVADRPASDPPASDVPLPDLPVA